MMSSQEGKHNPIPVTLGKPKSLLNKQFLLDCDGAVAVFWTRFPPTDNKEPVPAFQ